MNKQQLIKLCATFGATCSYSGKLRTMFITHPRGTGVKIKKQLAAVPLNFKTQFKSA